MAVRRYFNIRYDPSLTSEENDIAVRKKIEAAEAIGFRIISTEPIEEIFVKVIGQKIGFETDPGVSALGEYTE